LQNYVSEQSYAPTICEFGILGNNSMCYGATEYIRTYVCVHTSYPVLWLWHCLLSLIINPKIAQWIHLTYPTHTPPLWWVHICPVERETLQEQADTWRTARKIIN